MTLMSQVNNAANNIPPLVEDALMEIRTRQNGMEERQMQMMNMIEEIRNQTLNMDNKIDIMQTKAMKYSQLDEYFERKRFDKENMAEYLSKRERGWKY